MNVLIKKEAPLSIRSAQKNFKTPQIKGNLIFIINSLLVFKYSCLSEFVIDEFSTDARWIYIYIYPPWTDGKVHCCKYCGVEVGCEK
jgi:hypothetical protein